MPDHTAEPVGEPIDMVLFCPQCGVQHVDAPESGVVFMQDASGHQGDAPTVVGAWDNPPHRSHLCHACGHVWRPADVPTNGVPAIKTTGKADSPIAQPSWADGGAPAVDEDVKAARAILARLCEEGFVRMSIPVHPGDEDMVLSRVIDRAALATAERSELDRLRILVNTPTLHSFREGVMLEAIHQRERWGSTHDAGKTPADWFWLVGYLAGKALHAQNGGNTEKALHHTISTAAALANWHAAIAGDHTAMRPGINPAAQGYGAGDEGVCSHGMGFQCVTCWPHPAAPSDAVDPSKEERRPTHG